MVHRISFVWLIGLALLWWVLTASRADGFAVWIAGALAVGIGVLLHTGLGGRGPVRVRLGGLLGFLPFFLRQSISGGIDVARRALSPSLPLAPTFLEYPMRLPRGPTRVFFLNTISLLPGTFSARLDEGRITVHVLAGGGAARGRLERLEKQVARLFGVELGEIEAAIAGEAEGER